MALCTISGMVNKTAATGAGSDVKKRYRAAGFGCRTLAGNRNEQGRIDKLALIKAKTGRQPVAGIFG